MGDGNRGGSGDRAEAERRFRDAVAGIFGDRCKAAWFSGSFLYRGAETGRSDIDLVIVLDERTRLPADRPTLDRIRAFVDVYLAVHADLDLDPDLEFPAEYVVPVTIEQTLAWRGLALDGQVADSFPRVEHSDYWLGRPDRWFNAWLSEAAFSRYLSGDRAYHGWAKLEAWKTITRFLLLRSGGRPMSLEDFWPGLAQFGVKESYLPFWPQEEEWVRRAFTGLEQEGLLRREGDRVVPVQGALRAWEQRIARAIAADRSDGPLLLPIAQHDEVAEYAASRWKERSLVGALT